MLEALVSIVLSSLVVVLVGTTFIAQNRHHTHQVSRARAQDNARVVTDFVGAELRSMMDGGVKVAETDRITIRSPIVLTSVCAWDGVTAGVYTEGGMHALAEQEVSGFGYRGTAGAWYYYEVDWATMHSAVTSSSVAGYCAPNGADTVGVFDDFHGLRYLESYMPVTPAVGDVLMIFRETTFSFETSTLDPTAVGFLRKVGSETATELATGMDPGARFEYRTGGTTYSLSVPSDQVDQIDAVRVVARTLEPAVPGGEDVTAGWAVNVVLPNAR